MAQPTTPTPLHVSEDGMFAIPAKAHRHHRVLAANTAETFDVPLSANGTTRAVIAAFSATADIYVAYTLTGEGDNTATVPAGDVTDGTGMDLNPTTRNLLGVIKVSVISASNCNLSIQWFI